MRRSSLLVVSTALLLCPVYAAAQGPPSDSLKVDYFAYAHTTGAPDGTLRVSNPGTTGSNICADIFVFLPDQEMAECCSCLITPNGMRTLSVNIDLTNNSFTGVTPNTGSISIVSSATVGGTCPEPQLVNPTGGGIRSWVTHIDQLRLANKTTGFIGSSAPSQDATFSIADLSLFENDCSDILKTGNGTGLCTCGTGD